MTDYRWCGRKGSVGCCTGHDEEYQAMREEIAELRAENERLNPRPSSAPGAKGEK